MQINKELLSELTKNKTPSTDKGEIEIGISKLSVLQTWSNQN